MDSKIETIQKKIKSLYETVTTTKIWSLPSEENIKKFIITFIIQNCIDLYSECWTLGNFQF
ncbi:hypothetical protein DERF_015990 [Dermatophagoides farinae]|uniref:Uncharacterized protein n=1 Tax=Dermatophagoides farinae TaxID=6954 RepID=A0A922KW00_DERFA|nr:hypothetical protein DERF_015990 [Dermatophagoides farinae]